MTVPHACLSGDIPGPIGVAVTACNSPISAIGADSLRQATFGWIDTRGRFN